MNEKNKATQPQTNRQSVMMESQRESGNVKVIVLVIAVLAIAVVGVVGFDFGGSSEVDSTASLYTVERGDLLVSVVEGGTLQAAEPFEVKSEIEGQTTILFLAEEGTYVEAGDPLVELDVSELDDDLNRQEIAYEKAKAAKLDAEKSVLIQKSLNKSNIDRAELAVELAVMDQDKYLEADYNQELFRLENEIILARAELARAKEVETGSHTLAEKGYVSGIELEADKLDVKRKDLNLKLAEKNKAVLEEWTLKRETKVLQSDIDQARSELEREQAQAIAELAKYEADLKAKTATYELEERRLERLKEQQAKSKIVSKVPGLVVYATISRGGRRGGDDSPMEVGASVRERQLILSVTDARQMIVDVKIHESSLDKVRVGQKCRVTVDAIPDRTFSGEITKVGLLPDSQNMWLNPDLKVYSTKVTLDTDEAEGLRPGMSCTNEIICANLKDTLAVPIYAVLRQGRHFFCYVQVDGAPQIKEVEVGLHNERLVQVKSGLQEGDLVYLSPPADAPKPDFPDEEEENALEFEAPETIAEKPEGDRPKRGGRGEKGGRGGRGMGGAAMAEWNSMSEDERKEAMKKFREDYANMSEEEKAKLQERFGTGGGGE